MAHLSQLIESDMDPHEYCQQKAARSGSSFYYSFLFLPPPKRRAITALYAFCREVDDVVDECSDPGVARAKLAWWSEEVVKVFHGTPQHPVARALAEIAGPFRLPETDLQKIIAGMAMDLEYQRYPDFKALEHYCHHVAGVVGLLSAEIFGYTDPRTLEYASDLGLAFQLTNIVRDVGEDARRNRIYLPLEELSRFNVNAADVLERRQSDAFRQLMDFQIERAFSCYDTALAKLPAADRHAQRPGMVMAAIYRALLLEIQADPCLVLTRRTSLTPLRKLWIAWRTWVSV